jgi:hypothetical protein
LKPVAITVKQLALRRLQSTWSPSPRLENVADVVLAP